MSVSITDIVPTVVKIPSVYVNESTTIYFEYDSRNTQVFGNTMQVVNNDTNAIVYEKYVDSLKYENTIPANTLTPNTYYAVRFKVHMPNEESDWSSLEPFYCYYKPVISLNVSNNETISSSYLDATLTYQSQSNELFKTAILYLEGEDYYDTSGYMYVSTSTLPSSVSYTFKGLENHKQYSLYGYAETINGNIINLNKITLNTSYYTSVLHSSFELKPMNCEGYVSIKSNLISIDGESNPTQPIYINNEMVDCASCDSNIEHSKTSRYVKWKEGFEIPENFILSLWFYPSDIDENFIILSNNDNEKIYAKIIRGTSYDFVNIYNASGDVIASQQLTNRINSTDKCFMWLKSNNGNWTLTFKTLYREDTTFNWDSTNVNWNRSLDIVYDGETINDTTFTLSNKKYSARFTSVTIGNGIFDHIDITSDTSLSYSETIPQWTFKTILDCDFKKNINGGNIDVILSQISRLEVRRKDIDSDGWVCIYGKNVTTKNDLNIDLKDYFVPSGIEQTYALVPMLNNGIEGEYISNVVTPKWDGVFITDGKTTFKLYHNVIYDSTMQNVTIGTLNPIGLKYPIVIQNSENDYRSGTFTAQILGYNYEKNKVVDRNDIIRQSNDIIKFLKNGKAKIFKDWNGNDILFKLVSSPAVSYSNNYGNGIITIGFSWVEQGSYGSQDDLLENGLINL